ncbi:MAG: hypothetical protein KI790_18310, partial [Cyclobacteriaceae bacterium]|nr:hypothetical protein [Cyclobacteriaceae bacterium HetDA_MAG_MS6]
KLLDVLPNPEQVFYAFPRWIDNSNIVAMVRKNNQSALYLINTQTKTQRPISAFYDHQLAYPTTHDGITYFTSTFTGIDNIFALDQSTGIIYQVTSSLLGATQPNVSPDGKTLVFSEFSPMGFDVKSIAIDQTQWKRLKDQYPTAIDFYSPLLTETGNILNQVPEKQFAVTKYNKLSELIRIHSWIPWAAPPNLGLQIFGANKLTTLSAAGSIRYNANESTTSYGVSLSYGDLYTPIEAGYTRSNRSRNVPVYNERIRAGDTTISVQSRRREWVEHDASVGLVLPLNFLNGNHFTKLWLTGKYHLLDVDFDGDLTPDETFGALDLELDFFNLRRTARQQIAPRWGQSVTLNYNQTVGAEASETSTLTLGSRWYFPGLFRNHSFNIRADFQVESFTDSYKFRDNFFYARGYGSVLHDRIWKVGVNYALPLFYPDIALGPLAFIKRVKVNFFYDHSESTTDDIPINELAPISDVSFTGSFNGSTRTFRSVGAELTFDTRLFRLLEVDMGVRYSYLLDDVGLEKHQFNFIVFSIAF